MINAEYIRKWNEEEARLWALIPEPKDGRHRARMSLDENGRIVVDELHEFKGGAIAPQVLEK